MKICRSVGEYVEGLPEEVRARFELAWKVMCMVVPDYEEAIRYGMPTIRFCGRNLVYLAVMKNHFGFYPTPLGVAAFKGEIEGRYRYSKGAIQFPIGEKIPLALIRKIVKFRLKEERMRTSF